MEAESLIDLMLSEFTNYFYKRIDHYAKIAETGYLLTPFINSIRKDINDASGITEKINFSQIEMQRKFFLKEIVEYIKVTSGKYVRPLLAVSFSQIFGGRYVDAFPVASSLELFHTFTLIHDDIMDNSEYRRGYPTIHVKWGRNEALLAGDFIFACSIEELSLISRHIAFPRILSYFAKTAQDVCTGQSHDLQSLFPSFYEYLGVISLKTAALIRASIIMGALLGQNSFPEDDLSAFGYKFGILFQLYDDYKDIFLSVDETNKTPYSDLMNRKTTFPVFLLIQELNQNEKNEFMNIYTSQNMDENKIQKILNMMKDKDIQGKALRIMKDIYAQILESAGKIIKDASNYVLIETLMKKTFPHLGRE